MPKKQSPESPEDQSERFKRKAQKLIDARELSPTESDAYLDALVTKGTVRPAKVG